MMSFADIALFGMHGSPVEWAIAVVALVLLGVCFWALGEDDDDGMAEALRRRQEHQERKAEAELYGGAGTGWWSR